MKTNLIKLLLLMILPLLSDCSKEDVQPSDNDEIPLGAYELLQSSLDKLPYSGYNEVIFVDSAGNELVLDIEEMPLLQTNATLFRYNVFAQGDTVRYPYQKEIKSFRLQNLDAKLNFRLTLESDPFYNDPETGWVADRLTISCSDVQDPTVSYWVFSYLLDPRTYPENFATNVSTFDQMTFHGKTFEQVMKNDINDLKLELYFTEAEGIAAFYDQTGTLWRLEAIQ